MSAYWERWKADTTRPFALAFSMAFALLFTGRFYLTHAFIFLFLAFRFWMMSYFISSRLPPLRPIPLIQRGIAYASKSVPFFYRNPLPGPAGALFLFGETLALAGVLLSTWGIIDLGRRFGISPAKRGEVCRTGVYRWMKHPIYIGYALVEFDCVLLNPANLSIYLISMVSLVVRGYLENRVLQGFEVGGLP
jgi:hypothetical protein